MSDPDIARLAYQARLLYEAENYAEARDGYARLCEIDRGDAQSWFMRGLASYRLGEFGRAEECHRVAVQFMPGSPELHFNLALTLHAQNKTSEAIDSLRETLRLNPRHEPAAFSLSRLLVMLGRPGEALGYSLSALEHGAREPEMLQHFMQVLGMQQDVRALQQACPGIELCFDSPGIDLQQLSRPVTEILRREERSGKSWRWCAVGVCRR